MAGKPREEEDEEPTRSLWGKVPTDGPREHAREGLSYLGLQQLCCGQRAWERQQAGWPSLASPSTSLTRAQACIRLFRDVCDVRLSCLFSRH